MRRGPYSASEDALLEKTFGREAVAGRTVLCSAGASGADGDWNVVVVQDAAGALFLLECTRDAGGVTIASTQNATQASFLRVFERAAKDRFEDDDFDLTGWINAEQALADRDPEFDFEASVAVWERVKAYAAGKLADAKLDGAVYAPDGTDPEVAKAITEYADLLASGMRPN